MPKIEKNFKVKTFGDIAERWPPFLVYALARRNYKTKQRDEMVRILLCERAAISGLPDRTIQRIGSMMFWDTLSMKTVDAFCIGNNFSFFHTKKHRAFILSNLNSKSKQFPWLNAWEWKTFLKRSAQYEQLMAAREQ